MSRSSRYAILFVVAVTPRVALGLPVFNGEATLPLTLESVASQTYRDFELLIVDNASTDGTEQICRDFVSRHPFARYVRHDQNLGASENFNQAFRRTTGELFRWTAGDDLIDPTFLEACVRTYDAAPPTTVNVFPRRRFIDSSGDWIGDCEFRPTRRIELEGRSIGVLSYRELMELRNNVAPAIVFGLMRRDALDKTRLIGPFRSADCILNAELCLLGEHWQIPERLFSQRRHDADSWRANLSKEEQARWYAPKPKGGTRFPQVHLFREYLRSIWELSPDRNTALARTGDLMTFLRIRTGRTASDKVYRTIDSVRGRALWGAEEGALGARAWLSVRALARLTKDPDLVGLVRPWRRESHEVLADILTPLIARGDKRALAIAEAWLHSESERPIRFEAASIAMEAAGQSADRYVEP